MMRNEMKSEIMNKTKHAPPLLWPRRAVANAGKLRLLFTSEPRLKFKFRSSLERINYRKSDICSANGIDANIEGLCVARSGMNFGCKLFFQLI